MPLQIPFGPQQMADGSITDANRYRKSQGAPWRGGTFHRTLSPTLSPAPSWMVSGIPLKVCLSSLKPRHQEKGNFHLLLKPLSKYFPKDPFQNKTGIIHLLSKKYLLITFCVSLTSLGTVDTTIEKTGNGPAFIGVSSLVIRQQNHS